ncbi:MAG: phenylalanine--tRNA ligase subunit beta [candidate division Zixibacteria bacterium]|nr:phenylalanine--tRNA ligase subunit beta [candidate division Zixibacteria bacterium]
MKVGYRWLLDYVTVPWGPEELADRLTAIGTAVDGIAPVFERFEGVIVARIIGCETMPNRPDLRILTVSDGASQRTVVTGAPNAQIGLVVPLALPGARLPSSPDSTVGVRAFGGIQSEGFCCSERDLGLSEDHSGLMELDSEKLTLGRDLWESLELDDVTLSFELTPNRADCLSVFGIAREVGALVGSRIRRPDVHLVESADPTDKHLKVQIDDAEGCPRYAGRILRRGRVRPSAFWLKRRLRSAGQRPINNAVDITNFVMLETGQPLHAFDWGKFQSGQVLVRPSAPEESFVTLDDKERRLPAGTIMITDGGKPVAIGGIMGGQESEVSPETQDFLIESAYFQPSRIRQSRKRLEMASESAMRFERGVDPNGALYALDRAAGLFVQLTGGELLAGAVDNYPAPVAPLRIELDAERVNRFLGTSLSTPTMVDLLSSVEFGVVPGKLAIVTVPTFRPDVSREPDLAEEIARLHGYEKIPINRRAAGVMPTHRLATALRELRMRELIEGMGFTQIVCNSLVDPSQRATESGEPIMVRNPLSTDLSALRGDLYGSLLTVVSHNLNRRVDSIAVYESGAVYRKGDQPSSFHEQRQLILALCGQAPGSGWDQPARPYDYFDLRGAVTALAAALAIPLEITPHDGAPFCPSEGFKVTIRETPLGQLGRIDPDICRRFGVKEKVWAVVLDFELLCAHSGSAKLYVPLPRFPALYRDLAVVIADQVPIGDLQRAIRATGGALVDTCTIFDLYSGAPIPSGSKSVAFALAYRHEDRTLTDDEADRAHAAIVSALSSQFGARLRE